VSVPRELADRFHQRWLEVHPLAATSYGIPGYDHLVPDASEAADAAWRAEAEAIAREVDAVAADDLPIESRVTLGCLREAAAQEIDVIDSAPEEHTVTPMPFADPGSFLAVSARAVLVDAATAEAYVTRLRGSGEWIDQLCDRLRTGAAKGRLPVAHLVEQAIAWADDLAAEDAPAPVMAARPPEGWSGAGRWEEERRRAAEDVVKPALIRWRDVLRGLLPDSRDADHAGLCHVPGGDADYTRFVRLHTTMPATAEELHRIGMEEISVLEEKVRRLGAELGFTTREEAFAALRESAGQVGPDEAIRQAVAAVRRAEARAPEFFPAPLPPPCEVTAMPPVVATSGTAPHYTPPRLDGGRAGTFWFNTLRPTAGTGWDMEVVAFHEAVPGHHLQLSRLQLLTELPALQRQRSLTVFSEGWGLYAEELAEEIELYRDARSRLGSVCTSLMRAARLVVDTGLHAFGWTRSQALEFFTEHVPLPVGFLANEVDRYIVMPGQALAYLTGKLEIMRLRAQARARLGSAFSLPVFHAAVLDQGSLPMPVLADSIAAWAARGAGPDGNRV
jgi:uncharacterized protein (DUF885 family)